MSAPTNTEVGIWIGSLPDGGSCEAFATRTHGGGTSERLAREATNEGASQ